MNRLGQAVLKTTQRSLVRWDNQLQGWASPCKEDILVESGAEADGIRWPVIQGARDKYIPDEST